MTTLSCGTPSALAIVGRINDCHWLPVWISQVPSFSRASVLTGSRGNSARSRWCRYVRGSTWRPRMRRRRRGPRRPVIPLGGSAISCAACSCRSFSETLAVGGPFDLHPVGGGPGRPEGVRVHHYPARHGVRWVLEHNAADISGTPLAAESSRDTTFDPLRVGGTLGRAYTMPSTPRRYRSVPCHRSSRVYRVPARVCRSAFGQGALIGSFLSSSAE